MGRGQDSCVTAEKWEAPSLHVLPRLIEREEIRAHNEYENKERKSAATGDGKRSEKSLMLPRTASMGVGVADGTSSGVKSLERCVT